MKETIGISGVLKTGPIVQRKIGFTPVGKYNDDDSYSIGDCMYGLREELGSKLYSKVEHEIMRFLNEDDARNGILITDKGRIDWEIITKEEFENK